MSRVDEWREQVVSPKAKDATLPRSALKAAPPRPSSAGLPGRKRTQQAVRPKTSPSVRDSLAAACAGKVLKPLWRVGVGGGTNDPMDRGFVSRLKHEILTLQQKIDAVGGQQGADKHDLQQRLFLHQYDSDAVRHLRNGVLPLFDLLVDRISHLASLVTAKAADTALTSSTTSSTATSTRLDPLLQMADVLCGIARRKDAWREAAAASLPLSSPPLSATKHAQTLQLNTANSAAFDEALNEPAVSQLQCLIEQQRKLQAVLQQQVDASRPSTADAKVQTAVAKEAEVEKEPEKEKKEGKEKEKGSDKEKRGRNNDKEKEKEREEKDALIAELKSSLNAYQNRTAAAARYVVTALADVDTEYLRRVGIDTPALSSEEALSPEKAEAVVTAIREAVAAAESEEDERDTQAGTPTPPPMKKAGKPKELREEDGLPPAGVFQLAQLHKALLAQNKSLVDVVSLLKQRDTELDELKVAGTRQRATAASSAAALREQLESQQANFTRQLTDLGQQLSDAEDELVQTRKSLYATLASKQGAKKAHVATTKDPPGPDYIERELAKRIKAHEMEQARMIEDQENLQQQKEEVIRQCDVAQRDNASLRRLLKEAEDEIQNIKEEVAAKSRDLRTAEQTTEKYKVQANRATAARDEDRDNLRKLSVEVSICRNTIRDLREREGEVAKHSTSNEWKWQYLKQQLEQERTASTEAMTQLRNEMERVKDEAEQQAKSSEELKQHFQAKDAELRRLKETEAKLQGLQRDFKNYTLTRIQQGESAEEEERRLQECLVMLNTELFRLPENSTPEDVELLISELAEKKRNLEAEQVRQERQHKRNAMGQVVLLLKRRMNIIQLHAFREKRVVFSLQKEVQELKQVLAITKQQQQNDMSLCTELSIKLSDAEEGLRISEEVRADMQANVIRLTEELSDVTVKVDGLQKEVTVQQSELAEAWAEVERLRHGTPLSG